MKVIYQMINPPLKKCMMTLLSPLMMIRMIARTATDGRGGTNIERIIIQPRGLQLLSITTTNKAGMHGQLYVSD